jgi:hypothetical protein
VLLWLASLGLGLLDIYAAQFITLSVYARFFLKTGVNTTPIDVATANSLRISTVLAGALIYVIFMIATTEFHFKRMATQPAWKILGITIGVELVIILLATVFGPVTW